MKELSDVKNEIKIVTLMDDLFALWEEFPNEHVVGDLINLETMQPNNAAKGFNHKSCSVKQEFFRHLGHFTDKDLKFYIEHLLGMTPNMTTISEGLYLEAQIRGR